jgi:hypothetical protein
MAKDEHIQTYQHKTAILARPPAARDASAKDPAHLRLQARHEPGRLLARDKVYTTMPCPYNSCTQLTPTLQSTTYLASVNIHSRPSNPAPPDLLRAYEARFNNATGWYQP